MRKLLTLITILLLLIPSFVFSNEPLVSMTQQECRKIKEAWKDCSFMTRNYHGTRKPAHDYQKDNCRRRLAPEVTACYGYTEPVPDVYNGCFINSLKENKNG